MAEEEPDPDQPDPWAAAVKSGTAPKPKAKVDANSWGGFKPDEVEPLPEDLQTRKTGGGGKTGKAKAWKSKAAPSGPNLPRKRVLPDKVTGQVLEWKGKYGWIMPLMPIHHSKAYKHQGKIYISVTDFVGECTYLKPGSLCEFFIFEDEAGLGAEECAPAAAPPWKGKGAGGWQDFAAKGGKAGAASIAQSGGSRPSAERGGRGGGRKGGGAKGGGGKPGGDLGQAGLAAPDLASLGAGGAGLEALGAAGLGRGGASAGLASLGRGGRDGGPKGRGRGGSDAFGGARSGGASKGGSDSAGVGLPGSKGGRSGADSMRSALGRGSQPFGKGAGQGAAAAGGAAIPGGVPGGGTWDAFVGSRAQQDQHRALDPFTNQGAFVDHSRPMGAFGQLGSGLAREQGLPQAAPSFMDQGRQRDPPAGHGPAFDPGRPPDSLMSQTLFDGQGKGMPMVQDQGLDPQRAWELMRNLNMQAPMAGGGLSGLGPSFGQPFPGAAPAGSAPFAGPSYAGGGFGFGGFGPELDGFPRPLGGFPAPVP